MVGHAKIVFGNAREMTALAQALNVKYDDVTDIPFLLNSLKRITVDVSSASCKDWLADDGIFVMTRGGSAPAIIVWGKGQSVQVCFLRDKNHKVKRIRYITNKTIIQMNYNNKNIKKINN